MKRICGNCKHYRPKSMDDGYCIREHYLSDKIVDYDRDYKCKCFTPKKGK